MTTNDFNKVVEEFISKTEATLIKKQDEYNLGDDRFDFFKREARIDGTTPEIALYYCMLKHFTSFQDMVKSGDKFTKELWIEKLGDMANYLILLYGLLEDDNMFKETK